MSQLERKWIQDGAINASKIDASSADQTYVMHGLNITADATIGGGFQVIGNAVAANLGAYGNAQIGNDMTVGGHTVLNNALQVAGDSTVSGNSSVIGNSRVGGDMTVIGHISVGVAPIFPSLNVTPGTSNFVDATFSSGIKVGGDGTVSGGLQVVNSLTAPKINGDSTVSGGFKVTKTLTGVDSSMTGNSYLGGNLGIGVIPNVSRIQVATAGGSGIDVDGDLNSYGFGQFLMRGATNSNKQLWMGLNTTDNVGYIKAFFQGTGVLPLSLNPTGGNVGINTIVTPATLTVNGTLNASGDSTIGGGLQVTNSLTAPKINGDSTISGGFSISGRTTTTSLVAPSIVGDSTVSGGLKITNSLTVPQINGDSTFSGTLGLAASGTTTASGFIRGEFLITRLAGAYNNTLVCESNGSDAYFRATGGTLGSPTSARTYVTADNGLIWIEAKHSSVTIKSNADGVNNNNITLDASGVGSNVSINSDGSTIISAGTNLSMLSNSAMSLTGGSPVSLQSNTGDVNLTAYNYVNITAPLGLILNGNLTVTTDASFGGNVFTTALTAFPSSITGFSSFTANSVYYKQIGKTIHIWYDISGPSNSTFFNFTLPQTASINAYGTAFYIVDTTSSDIPGFCFIQTGQSKCLVGVSPSSFPSWANTGAKGARGYICYEMA
jgi:hypothetical protein